MAMLVFRRFIMVKDTLIRVLVDEDLAGRYKKYCKRRKVSVSDDLRTYILSVIDEADDLSPREEKNSGKEEIDPKTGFRKNIQFNNKGFIKKPRTEAEAEYNRRALRAAK
jgi:hypothetical protein